MRLPLSRSANSNKPFAGERGISLLELMVGIAISLMLLAGTTTALLRVLAAGNDALQGTRLNQHLRTTLDRIAKDLQRAGYVDGRQLWSGEALSAGNSEMAQDAQTYLGVIMPGLARFAGVALFSMPAQAPCDMDCSCILFSYDLNEDGEQGVAVIAGDGQNTVNRELFGYRLANDEVQMRWAGGGGVNSCGDGQWLAVSERDLVEITALNFTLSQSVPDDCEVAEGVGAGICPIRRQVAVRLAGRLTADPNLTLTLVTSVTLANHYPQVVP
ncbi:MAG: hypothetical protein WC997_13030 [Porticoccaceae bacterium]